MARPKSQNSLKRLDIRITPKQMEYLERVAESRGTTVSSIVRDMLDRVFAPTAPLPKPKSYTHFTPSEFTDKEVGGIETMLRCILERTNHSKVEVRVEKNGERTAVADMNEVVRVELVLRLL